LPQAPQGARNMIRLPGSLPYALLFGALFLTLGVVAPYWPVYLESRGIGADQIGLALALGIWLRIPSSPIAGQLADRSGRPRTILTAYGLAALAAFALFPLAEGFALILAVQLLTQVTLSPLIPLAESQTMAAVKSQGLDYGRIRLWGSVTFIVGVMVTGELLDLFDAPGLILVVVMASLGLTVLATLTLPRPSQSGGLGADKASLLRLLRDRVLLRFLLAAALLQASHAGYFLFSALHWRASGLSGGTIGLLWAEGVVAEIALFWLGGKAIARIGPRRLLMLAALGGLLRWSVLAFTVDPWALAGVQWLHAATFGMAHLGTVHFIAHRAPPGLQATAQSLNSALAAGLVMGLAMLVSGWLFERYGAPAFLAMAAMSLAGGVLAWSVARRVTAASPES
jgi:PPP family 3-phenylpropionic acid transporter